MTLLVAQTDFSQYPTAVAKVDNNYLYVPDSQQISIGTSGVVMHSFDEEHKTIIANVEVVEKKEGSAVLKYKRFKGLQQSALPSYDITPQKGDKVILNYLYDKAMAIVPDSKTLQYVTTKFNNVEWVHPDIFGAKLAVEYTPVPKKNDFKSECRENSFSLLFFAVEDDGYFVDCNSFKILAKTKLPKSSSTPKVPFYTRLKEIKGRMFGLMGGKGINNYNGYYKKLLNVR